MALTEKEKEESAVLSMRRMLEKYANEEGITYEEAWHIFRNSRTYDALFDYETELWKEGPDYLKDFFREILAKE